MIRFQLILFDPFNQIHVVRVISDQLGDPLVLGRLLQDSNRSVFLFLKKLDFSLLLILFRLLLPRRFLQLLLGFVQLLVVDPLDFVRRLHGSLFLRFLRLVVVLEIRFFALHFSLLEAHVVF